MAYGQDLKGSARRHWQAAQDLHDSEAAGRQPGYTAVAGYLFGLAGELAIKAMMLDSGMLPSDDRRDDPFYKHFPELKHLLSQAAKGRRYGELRAFAENSALFQEWDTDMRYAPTSDIKADWVEKWRKSAAELMNKMNQ